MTKRLLSTILILCLLFSCLSCSEAEVDNSGISVVATLFPQYDFARAIVGEKGSVELLLPPGADSHSFELTASDIYKINTSDIFIYTGRSMEIWVDTLIDSIDKKVNILNMSERVELLCADDHSHHGHGHEHHNDPHIWTSPVNAMAMLKTVYDSVCSVDPSNKDYYTNNYNEYLNQLMTLDSEFRALAATSENKTIYFSGKFAFTYFVHEYGFNYRAPFDSCSDLQVEDLASVVELINEMKINGVKYIFYEEFANDSVYTTISNETDAKPLLLHSAHNVIKDDFDNGVSYIDIMRNNLSHLKKALQ